MTSKSEHQKGVNGALEAKFFHAKSGVMFDKAKVTWPKNRKCVYIYILPAKYPENDPALLRCDDPFSLRKKRSHTVFK